MDGVTDVASSYGVSATVLNESFQTIATATPVSGDNNALKAKDVKKPRTFNVRAGFDYYQQFPEGFTGQKVTTEPTYDADEVEFKLKPGAKVKVYLVPQTTLFSADARLWMKGDPSSELIINSAGDTVPADEYRVPHKLVNSGNAITVVTRIAGRLFPGNPNGRGKFRGTGDAFGTAAWRGEARDILTWMQASGLVQPQLDAQVSAIEDYFNASPTRGYTGIGAWDATHGDVDYLFEGNLAINPVQVIWKGKLMGTFEVAGQMYYVWANSDKLLYSPRPRVYGYASMPEWYGMRPEALYTGTDFDETVVNNPNKEFQS